jgi:hypothetical protein
MRIGKYIRICFGGILLAFSFSIFAAAPVWTFTPLTPTSFSVTTDSVVTVLYRMTNESRLTHVLAMEPVIGISQITSNGYCANPFELGYHQSCILNLQIQGSALQGNVSDAPIVCQAGATLLCYQPPVANRLAITLLNKINLTVGNSPLTLQVGGGSGNIKITNTSEALTSTNVQADLSGTALSGNVLQNASNCVSLAPGQTCTLVFTPIVNAVTLTSFPIVGGNANPATGQIQIIAASIATISVSGSPLTLQATTGTPVTGSLTITNQSNTVTALNISADISGALASGGVVENSSSCNTLLPLQSCNLVFTPGTQAVSNTNVPIKGSNTSVTTANIAVNAAPQATLTITAGSPLALMTNGSSGAMTIKNNSTTENALSITSNFTSTALNGLVTETGNTCSSVAPGASCTLTFTPGSSAVSQTNFPIQGINTNSVNGAISITVPIHIIFVSNTGSTGNLGGFSGADAKCNSDSAKPSTGFAAGYTYKALLNGNNATVNGISYFRTDGTTPIATATGGNLATTLTNSISTSSTAVWTGSSSNCTTWTSNSNSIFGSIGFSNNTNVTWFSFGSVTCGGAAEELYCVSQ